MLKEISRICLLAAAALLLPPNIFAQGERPDSSSAASTIGLIVGKMFKQFSPPAIRSHSAGSAQSIYDFERDGKLQLTLSDAIGLALKNNLDITVEKYDPDAAFYRHKSSFAPFDLTFNLSSYGDRNTTPAPSLLAGAESVLNKTANVDWSIRKLFRTGTEVDLTFTGRRLRTNSFFFTFNPNINTAMTLSFRQPLLRNFGRDANSRVIKITGNNLQISKHDFARRVIEIINQVQNAYWDLVLAREELKIREKSLGVAERTLADTRARFEVGMAAEVDVFQARAEVETRREQLISAQHNVKSAEDRLKALLTPDIDPGQIAEQIEPLEEVRAPEILPFGPEEAVRLAIQNRPEIKQAELDVENRRIEVKFSHNQLKPRLDLVASYSQYGLGGVKLLRPPGNPFSREIIGIEPGGLTDSLRDLLSGQFNGYTLRLDLTLPIGNTAGQTEYAQAAIAERKASAALTALKQKVALEVRLAYNEIAKNTARIVAAEAARQAAEKSLQGEQAKFEVGVTTLRDLLAAQRDLTAAQALEMQTKVDYLKSLANLEKAMGTTLAKNRVQIDDLLSR